MANKKETKTHFNYNRLWKLLIDRGIQKQELHKKVMSVPYLSRRWEEARMLQQMCFSVSVKRFMLMWKTLWKEY